MACARWADHNSRSSKQVQAAIRDGRGAPRPATNGSAAVPPSPTARGKGALPALPEGAEAALLYVRFRAAAEPGLKGMSACRHP